MTMTWKEVAQAILNLSQVELMLEAQVWIGNDFFPVRSFVAPDSPVYGPKPTQPAITVDTTPYEGSRS